MGNDGVIFPTPHGENTQNLPSKYQGVVRQRRGDKDIRGVSSVGTEVDGVTGIRMPGKGGQPRETQRTLHVSELEGKGGDYTGVTGTYT